MHLLKYLKGSLSKGLFYPMDNSLRLQAFSDFDWASCPICLLGLGGGQIAWFEDPLVKGKIETRELVEKDGQY